MNAQSIASDERIAITLKNLVDLAGPAASLNLSNGKIRASQSGNYVSQLKGRGMAFEETRLYQPGDDVRRMDWRVTARTDKPHSKIFREEREKPLFISVDYRSTMQFATRGVFKSVQAARLAGLLAWAALRRGDRIGGQIFSNSGCQELKPHTGKSALLHFFNALVNPVYQPIAENNFEKVLGRLMHHAHPGSQVFILSDFRGLTAAAEYYLASLARHCDVVLVLISDPLEIRLPVKGRYRFTDMLREVVIDSSDQSRLNAYQQQFEARRQYLQQLCRKLRMSWLTCSTNRQPIETLLAFYGKPGRNTSG
ncbi:MAG: DUF58 domain-containing protein [Methylococcales bacterium]|nr:DUF58 domain-containing protein [Methylococcales bacterium]